MGFSAAPDIFQMHAIFQAAKPRVVDRVACLIGSPIDSEALPAELQHFWHEREGIELTILIQCGKDLLSAADFHFVTCANV
jgi:hypothetical protein